MTDLIERVVPFTTFAPRDTRPLRPVRGDCWWQDVDEILTSWTSCDGGDPEPCLGIRHPEHSNWECLLENKRQDFGYSALRRRLMADGFTEPLEVSPPGPTNTWHFGNGHHRLAIAIELGYTHVPVHWCDWRTCEFHY